MFSKLRNLIIYLFPSKKETPQRAVGSDVGILIPVTENPYSLFDWVMVNSRYGQVQESIRKNITPQFDPMYDVGVIVGMSSKFIGQVPQYYITDWFNPRDTEKPITRKYTHHEITQIVSPGDALAERGAQLDNMFQAFFLNWLDTFNPEGAPKN